MRPLAVSTDSKHFMILGATFSEPYALSLGLEPRAAFRGIVRELGLRVVRLCCYWDSAEPEPGRFDFGFLDRQVEEAANAGLDIILAVGQKAPRWPEFHRPAWTSPDDPAFEGHLLRMLEAIVRAYRDAPISMWQVENEPYLAFGGPPLAEDLLRREIELVRHLDDRPVMLTDSADKGEWAAPARLCDVLGVNLYTRHWNGRRYADIDVPPSRYSARVRSLPPSVKRVIVSELQAEPWGPRPVAELTAPEAAETMDPERLRRNVELAAAAGFETVLFWGAEWWYWLRVGGDSSMWEGVRSLA